MGEGGVGGRVTEGEWRRRQKHCALLHRDAQGQRPVKSKTNTRLDPVLLYQLCGLSLFPGLHRELEAFFGGMGPGGSSFSDFIQSLLCKIESRSVPSRDTWKCSNPSMFWGLGAVLRHPTAFQRKCGFPWRFVTYLHLKQTFFQVKESSTCRGCESGYN